MVFDQKAFAAQMNRLLLLLCVGFVHCELHSIIVEQKKKKKQSVKSAPN